MRACRGKESEIGVITGNDTAPLPNDTQITAPRHAGKTFPTPSGINTTEAERICKNPIIMSPAYSACSNFTMDSVEDILDFCKKDLLVNIIE